MQTMNTEYAPAKIVLYDGGETKEIFNDGDRIKHISIRTNSYDGNVVGIGGVYSPQCTVVMQEEDGIRTGTSFELYYEISGEWKNEGVFFVNGEPEYSGGDMSFTAGGILDYFRNVIFEFEDFYRTNRTTTVKDIVNKVNEILELDVSRKLNIPSADFGKWEISCPLRQTNGNNYLPSFGEESKITIGELLSGLAVMYGGNIIEREGTLYLSSVFSMLGVEAFDISDCFPGFSLSKRSYALQMIKVSSMPSVKKRADYPELGLTDMEWLVYSGTSRASRAIYRKEKDQINSDVTYIQAVECDWAGTYVYAGDGSPAGPIFNATYSQGSAIYHTGELSFAGTNEDLRAGAIVRIKIDEDTTIPFMIGEVSLEWDGGFTTTISCNFGIDASSGEHKSQTTSSYESERNATSGMVQRNNAVYADTILSNVARISELFAKTLTADEAFIGELTANKAFIEDLTASTAFIEDLKANAITTEYIKSATAEIGYLTAEEADLGYAKIDLANIKEASITDAMIRNATIGFEKVNRSFIGNLTVSAEFVNAIRGITASFGYLDADKADLRYANITFGNIDTANIDVAEVANLFTQVGIIDQATINNGKITGTLDAVNVKIDAGSISMGTLDCGTIDVTNLKADSITVGQINGYQIAPGAIDMSNLSQAVTGEIETASENASDAVEKALEAFNNAQSATNAANAAKTTADGKNTVFYQAVAPTGTHRVNDVWFDTDDANKMYGWNGSVWSDKQFGTNAIANAAITNAKISNLDAGKITTGILNAGRIGANSITANKVAIADFTNYATFNENVPESISEEHPTLKTLISGGYLIKASASSKWLLLSGFSKNFFSGGEKIFYEMSIKGSVSQTIAPVIYFYNNNYDGQGVSRGKGTQVVIDGTERVVSGEITVSQNVGSFLYFIVGVENVSGSIGQIYARKVRFIRKNSSNLIVDGAITSVKLDTGAVTSEKISAGAVKAGNIGAGAVTAEKISAGAVTTDKLSVGTGGNIYATGYDIFEQITNQTLQYAITGASATIDTSRHYIGTRCLKILSTNASNYTYLGYSGNGYGCVPVVSGKTYIVSAYMRSSTPLTAKIYAIGHESIDSVNRVVSGQGSFSVSTSWSRVFFRFTASSSYPYISIRIDGGGNGTALWVDAIQIETGTASQSPSDFKPAGTTLINGGRIITNSITAAQIDVNNLFAQNITASGSITGAKLYGTYAEITNGKVGIFSITQYALTYESADYKSILDRAGLTLGLKYGGSSALNNYSTYKASGITCRYQEGGNYVFHVNTNGSGALLIDNVISPETAHSGAVGTLSNPFKTGYFDAIRGGSPGNLELTAPAGQIFMGGGAIRLVTDMYPQSNNTCKIGWPTYRFLEVNATTVNATKFTVLTGTMTAVNCTFQENHLYKIGNIVFLHVVFSSTYTGGGYTTFVNIPAGYRPKSGQHDQILTHDGRSTILRLWTDGTLQVAWSSGMGGIRYTTCYVAA